MARLKVSPLPAPSLDNSRKPRADPRWRLTADPRLTPFMEYLLLVGKPPDGRIWGWVNWAALTAADVDAVWTRHRGDLMAEAQFYGFAAAFPRGPEPSGPEFDAWQADFLKRHTY